MMYEIPVRFTGRIMYTIEADNEQDAMVKADELAEEGDCRQLEYIDSETNRPVARWEK